MPSNCTKCSVSSSSLRTTCPACHATKRREELIVKDCSSSRVIPVPDRTTFRQVLDDFNRAVGGQYTNLYTESDREIALESTVDKDFLKANKVLYVVSEQERKMQRLSPLAREIAMARGGF